jgi:hypothetical protein
MTTEQIVAENQRLTGELKTATEKVATFDAQAQEVTRLTGENKTLTEANAALTSKVSTLEESAKTLLKPEEVEKRVAAKIAEHGISETATETPQNKPVEHTRETFAQALASEKDPQKRTELYREHKKALLKRG